MLIDAVMISVMQNAAMLHLEKYGLARRTFHSTFQERASRRKFSFQRCEGNGHSSVRF
jgi:hypothetical protein